MNGRARLRDFLDASPSAVLAEITEAKGSTPREVAAWMLVSPETIWGTIGGGQLEFMAISRAREMIENKVAVDRLDIPLGPEIGQCCGGRVRVLLTRIDDELRKAVFKRVDWERDLQPHVYLFGGGHVGHALAAALSLLPLTVTVVETRPEALEEMPQGVLTLVTAVPEEAVRDAPSGAAFLVLTHDHALDFLIVAEALRRGDAAYVGMIGSRTKKATFRSWFMREGDGNEAEFLRLVSPIGGDAVKDKRPAVIAALAAAEVMTALAAGHDKSGEAGPG